MKRNGYAKRGEMTPREYDRNLCWAVNNMLQVLGCRDVADCQPTTLAGVANVAFGRELLKRQVNVDLRQFAEWLKRFKTGGEECRAEVLATLERKFSKLSNNQNQPTNDNDN